MLSFNAAMMLMTLGVWPLAGSISTCGARCSTFALTSSLTARAYSLGNFLDSNRPVCSEHSHQRPANAPRAWRHGNDASQPGERADHRCLDDGVDRRRFARGRGLSEMAQETFTKDQLWAELEKLGKDKVRERLATGSYGDVGNKRGLVKEWVLLNEQSRRDAAEAAQMAIACSARNAAWVAAVFAAIAALAAIMALFK